MLGFELPSFFWFAFIKLIITSIVGLGPGIATHTISVAPTVSTGVGLFGTASKVAGR